MAAMIEYPITWWCKAFSKYVLGESGSLWYILKIKKDKIKPFYIIIDLLTEDWVITAKKKYVQEYVASYCYIFCDNVVTVIVTLQNFLNAFFIILVTYVHVKIIFPVI